MSFPAYPAYKDSGAEWLGEVPEHWGILTAKRLFGNVRESAKPDAEQLAATQAYGVIPQKDFMEKNDVKVVLALSGTESFRGVRADDFVISLRSFQGGIEHSAYDGCVSPAYTVLRRRDERNLNPVYFKYLLKDFSYVSALQSVTTGIREGRTITYEQFGSLPLPVTPVAEQTQIARFLDHETARIDALIEEQQRLIELLKEKRQAVISHAVTKGLDPTVPMKDSGVEWLGEVPAHWIVTKIKYICYVNDGNHGEEYPKSDDFTTEDNGVPFIRGGNLENYKVSDSDMLFITPEKNRSMRKGRLMSGDILFVNRGEIGKLAMVPSAHAGSNLNSQIAYLRLISPEFINGFLMYYLDGEGVKSLIASSKEGSVLTQFPIGDLNSIYVAAPPKCEQEKIVIFLSQKVNGFDALISEAVTGVELLKERRSALISAAVTGKIDVRNW